MTLFTPINLHAFLSIIVITEARFAAQFIVLSGFFKKQIELWWNFKSFLYSF